MAIKAMVCLLRIYLEESLPFILQDKSSVREGENMVLTYMLMK